MTTIDTIVCPCGQVLLGFGGPLCPTCSSQATALAELGRLAYLTFAHGTDVDEARWDRLPEDLKRYWQERGAHYAALTRDGALLESVTLKPLAASEWWCDLHRLRTSHNPCCTNARVTEWEVVAGG